jgi:hypothetical protein
MIRTLLWLTGTAGLCLAVLGCSGRTSKVSGTVTLDNKPLEGAVVIFEPEDKKGADSNRARTDASGKFTLPANKQTRRSLKPGRYRVSISLKVDKKSRKSVKDEELPMLEMSGMVVESIPAAYSNPSLSQLRAEIKDGGDQDLPTFELKSK